MEKKIHVMEKLKEKGRELKIVKNQMKTKISL